MLQSERVENGVEKHERAIGSYGEMLPMEILVDEKRLLDVVKRPPVRRGPQIFGRNVPAKKMGGGVKQSKGKENEGG